MTNSPAPATAIAPFFADADFDYAARNAIGHAARGAMDIGQVLVTLARIENGNPDSWYTAWRSTADKLRAQATSRLTQGHTHSAGQQFLAASECYDQALSFSDGMGDQTLFAPTFSLHRQCWEAFVDTLGARAWRIAVPYEGGPLPGYLFRPDDSGAARPTLVITNGSDGSLAGLWATSIAGALARGWNAFVYDGPGQQSMLFERGVPFRPDWEAVLTPVVDSLVARGDVDPARLFAYGISQAGFWVARALAFEQRFVAAAADPGVVDVATSWLTQLPPELVEVLKAGDKETFNGAMAQVEQDPKLARTLAFRSRPYGKATPFDTYTAVLSYNLRDVFDKIRTPLLIADPENEQFWPGQAEELYKNLAGERELVRFAAEDGADEHCQPLGRLSFELAMFDFFEQRLAKPA